jgi:uncharacterized BrkB/YihY/UPF0761 family membrane protein
MIVAASPRLAARPMASSSRTAVVAVAVAGLVVLSLAFVHPIAELGIVAIAPGLLAAAFSQGIRAEFRRYSAVAAVVSGLTGAVWLIATADPGENVPGVLIGALVSLVFMVALAAGGAWLIDRVLRRRGAWRG